MTLVNLGAALSLESNPVSFCLCSFPFLCGVLISLSVVTRLAIHACHATSPCRHLLHANFYTGFVGPMCSTKNMPVCVLWSRSVAYVPASIPSCGVARSAVDPLCAFVVVSSLVFFLCLRSGGPCDFGAFFVVLLRAMSSTTRFAALFAWHTCCISEARQPSVPCGLLVLLFPQRLICPLPAAVKECFSVYYLCPCAKVGHACVLYSESAAKGCHCGQKRVRCDVMCAVVAIPFAEQFGPYRRTARCCWSRECLPCTSKQLHTPTKG
ncbi:hypothetical protein TRVL_02442 [Trypanosoma vivax]|nr:hypothetical protein TRVL_02442 [Trypanosoma vivax]